MLRGRSPTIARFRLSAICQHVSDRRRTSESPIPSLRDSIKLSQSSVATTRFMWTREQPTASGSVQILSPPRTRQSADPISDGTRALRAWRISHACTFGVPPLAQYMPKQPRYSSTSFASLFTRLRVRLPPSKQALHPRQPPYA